MKCGHCKDKHDTVAQVRACSLGHIQPTAPQFHPVTEPGMYRRDGEVYQVTKSKNDKLYAKKVVVTYLNGDVHRLDLEYAKGMIFNIHAEDRMSVEEVAQLGKISSHCYVCRHKLKTQKSIAVGIGPVCAKKV
jgi:Family of unknown function (DUF6011)